MFLTLPRRIVNPPVWLRWIRWSKFAIASISCFNQWCVPSIVVFLQLPYTCPEPIQGQDIWMSWRNGCSSQPGTATRFVQILDIDDRLMQSAMATLLFVVWTCQKTITLGITSLVCYSFRCQCCLCSYLNLFSFTVRTNRAFHHGACDCLHILACRYCYGPQYSLLTTSQTVL